jgi:hypothetical protein
MGICCVLQISFFLHILRIMRIIRSVSASSLSRCDKLKLNKHSQAADCDDPLSFKLENRYVHLFKIRLQISCTFSLRISDSALVAITLMIAESNPKEFVK